jgi:hypothetical protein
MHDDIVKQIMFLALPAALSNMTDPVVQLTETALLSRSGIGMLSFYFHNKKSLSLPVCNW